MRSEAGEREQRTEARQREQRQRSREQRQAREDTPTSSGEDRENRPGDDQRTLYLKYNIFKS